jgi:hypothetical protein
MRKGFLIYEEMRKYFSIYEEAVSNTVYVTLQVATAPLWISLYLRKIFFSFSSVRAPMAAWTDLHEMPGVKVQKRDMVANVSLFSLFK